MPLDDAFFCSIGKLGWTAGDALNALRPSGPMERVLITLRCEKCGKEDSLLLRELHEKGGVRTCGGAFDKKEFIDELKLLADGHAGPFTTLCLLPGVEEKSSQN